jgi:hypothetical protein
MQTLFFLKNWHKSDKAIGYFLVAVLLITLVVLGYNYIMAESLVTSWEKIQQQKLIDTVIHTFRLGPFKLSVPSESFVVFEYFSGSEIHHNLAATWIFLIVFALSISVLLAIVTTLETFWYFAGMSAFIILMIALRLDVLILFGQKGQILPIAILVLYVITTFYFKYIKVTSSLMVRCLAFIGISTAFALMIARFSTVEYPSVHLLITAYTPAMLLTILFIILVAHEILVAFVYITNQSASGNNAKHFAVISFTYLIYIIITCLHELNVVNWNIVYINPVLLLTISATLGIWGFSLRENLYENIFRYHPIGAVFYLSMACICFVTISQFAGNANDAAMTVVRQSIVFTHTGFGIIFVMYFFSNFLAMHAANLQVYKILYKPNRMPYFTFRFAGIIASLAFLFYSNWRDFVGHGIAGFYNYAGDLHRLQNNEQSAISFYEQSKSRSFQSNRPNYELGVLKTSKFSFETAVHNYELSNAKRPTEFSLVNQGNLNLWSGDYFPAIHSFKKSEKIMPSSAILKNNLAYAYAKVHALDSASFYMSAARKSDLTKSSAEGNFFAMSATELIPINADSIAKTFNSTSPLLYGNALVLATLFNQKLAIETDPLATKVLNLYSATFLNNYVTRNAKDLDTAFAREAMKIASDSVNLDYRESLKAAIANIYYHQGNVFKALEILGELAYITQSYQGKYNYIMGLWALEQRSPKVAASHFSNAATANYKEAPFYRAIALTEAGLYKEAEIAWDSLQKKEDEPIKQLSRQIAKILRLPLAQVAMLNDGEKYQFCRYRLGLRDSAALEKIVQTFENVNYQAQVLLDFSVKLHRVGKTTSAIRYLTRIGGLKLSDRDLYNEVRNMELLLLASRKDIKSLVSQMKNGITFDQQHRLEKLLYDALISEANGNKKSAEKNYNVLGDSNPYFEDGILAAVDFFRSQDQKSHKSYNILVNSIYVNPHSLRLMYAYAAEAARLGFDEYAISATETLKKLESEER